ncbi:MAG: hypothetical protein HQL56_01230 [Magnetococcales bacterium]|nr:hypothetical protein [Magnetococcales bacterium]
MTMTPQQHLEDVSRAYPGVWGIIDRMRADQGQKGLPSWPMWCFCPMAGTAEITKTMRDKITPVEVVESAMIAAMAGWRVTKGVYRFDPEVYQALIKTELTREIPAEVIYRLPEWSLYLETPDLSWLGRALQGFWVHLEWDTNSDRAELRLLLHLSSDALFPIALHLGNWTVFSAIEMMADTAGGLAAAAGVGLTFKKMDIKGLSDAITPLVSLVLYLCSEEPEIDDSLQPGSKPGRPAPRKTKKGWRLFEAEKVRVWDVGEKTGELVRKARDETDKESHEGRAAPRPHVRRAHWHTYWTGPKDGPRRAVLKWLWLIMVGVE